MTAEEHASHPLVFLTALGVQQQNDTPYRLGDATASASLAPLALLQLLPKEDAPDRVLALCTESATETTWLTLQDQVQKNHRVAIERVPIPDGNDRGEIDTILRKAVEAIPERCDLIVDVTHGYRHIPFVAYSLVLYLSALRGVRLRGFYYARFDGIPSDAPRPIVELSPLAELPRWFHAVQVFRDTGVLQPVAERLDELSERYKHRARQAPSGEASDLYKTSSTAKGLAGRLRTWSHHYEAGLPLELAEASEKIRGKHSQLPSLLADEVPLGDVLAEQLAEPVDATSRHETETKAADKRSIALDQDELKRQGLLVDRYLNRDQVHQALGLMREWLVSRVLLERGDPAQWLQRESRLAQERWLGALANLASSPRGQHSLDKSQIRLGRFWDRLGKARNALHHHGMKQDAVDPAKIVSDELRGDWQELRDCDAIPTTFGGGGGRLLVTALGQSPGVLFSALSHIECDRLLVVCTSETAGSIDDAVERARFNGPVEHLHMHDPHTGIKELESLVNEAKPMLMAASHVVANLTGGTTLMGIAVQQLVEEAQRLTCPTHRCVLIDQRPPEVQREEPFVVGDLEWLEGQDQQ